MHFSGDTQRFSLDDHSCITPLESGMKNRDLNIFKGHNPCIRIAGLNSDRFDTLADLLLPLPPLSSHTPALQGHLRRRHALIGVEVFR